MNRDLAVAVCVGALLAACGGGGVLPGATDAGVTGGAPADVDDRVPPVDRPAGWPLVACLDDGDCLALAASHCYAAACDVFSGVCEPSAAIEDCAPRPVEPDVPVLSPDAAEVDGAAEVEAGPGLDLGDAEPDADADAGPDLTCATDEDCVDAAGGDPCQLVSCEPETALCVLSLAPKSCGIAECGTDACGHSCGECPAQAQFCDDGTCRYPCGEVTLEGCCDGTDLQFCFQGKLMRIGCGNGCGWNGTADYYECGYAGPDPSGEHSLECPPLPH